MMFSFTYNSMFLWFIISYEQDLSTILRCCSLDSSLKILPCDFFHMDESVFFKLSSHIAKF